MRTHHRIYCTVYDDDDVKKKTPTTNQHKNGRYPFVGWPSLCCFRKFVTQNVNLIALNSRSRAYSINIVPTRLTYWDCVMGIYFAWVRVLVVVDRRRLLTARENATGRGDRRSTIDEDEDEDEFARGYDSRRRLATTTRDDGDGGISVLISVSCG